MRYFTFRFFHRGTTTAHSITIASTDEGDARAAAWAVLAEHADQHPHQVRQDWRLTSVIIRPVVDLVDALQLAPCSSC